jgi:hypothetical protein
MPGHITQLPSSWGNKDGVIHFQVGGVLNLREENMVMSLRRLRLEDDCAGKDKQQL